MLNKPRMFVLNLFYIVKVSLGKISGSEEPNRSTFANNTKQKLKLIKYSDGSKVIISK